MAAPSAWISTTHCLQRHLNYIGSSLCLAFSNSNLKLTYRPVLSQCQPASIRHLQSSLFFTIVLHGILQSRVLVLEITNTDLNELEIKQQSRLVQQTTYHIPEYNNYEGNTVIDATGKSISIANATSLMSFNRAHGEIVHSASVRQWTTVPSGPSRQLPSDLSTLMDLVGSGAWQRNPIPIPSQLSLLILALL